MTLRRSLNRTAAVQVLRNDRRVVAPVLVISGAFDRAAIMRAAVRRAHGLCASGLSWARRMSVALRFVWAEAKRAAFAAPRAA